MAKTDGVARIIALAALGKNGGGSTGGTTNENLDIYNIYTEISIDGGEYAPRPEGTNKELTDTYNAFEELINKLYVDGKKSFGVILHNKKWNLPLINYDIDRSVTGVPTLQDKPTVIQLRTPYLTQYPINGINTATATTLGMAKLDIRLLWDNDICTVSSVKYNWAQINVNNQTQVLSKTNTTPYTPTGDYNPATKKYVDDNKYTLPVASADTLGGIKIGDGLSVDEDGVVKPSPDVNVIFLDFHEVLEFPNSTIVTSRNGTLPEKYRLLIEGMINDALANGAEPGTFNIPNNLYVIAFKNYYMSLGTQEKASNLYGGNYSLWTTSMLPITDGGVANPQCSIYFRLTYDSSTNTVTLTGDVSVALQDNPSSVSKYWVNNNFLSKTNTNSYTPTSNYHPATKKYVDDSISSAIIDALGGSY